MAGPARPATAVPTTYGVRLADAIEVLTTTISTATRSGTTEARIELAPANLGSLQIHLQHTDDGIVARVVAAHAEAAETLQRGSDDLRQALQTGGAQLLSLDISHSDDQGRAASQREFGERGARGPDGTDGDAAVEESTSVTVTTLSRALAATTLVDVLA